MSYFAGTKELIINSYGLIVYTKCDKEIKFLMIQRNNTFGYIDIIKGKYDDTNINLIYNLINNMTNSEKENILNKDITSLWNSMWTKPTKIGNDIKMKFEKNKIFIRDIIKKSKKQWKEPEWEFPKGRKNMNESEMACAIREFAEETGINKSEYRLVENLFPYEEYNIGTNYKPYKFKYYLAYIQNNTVDITNYQHSEVKNVKWLSFNECLKKIRTYHYNKKSNLDKIYKLINTLNLI